MTYPEILSDYKNKFQKADDDETATFKSLHTFEEALLFAGLAISVEGKRLGHMNRLRYDALARSVTKLLKIKEVLSSQSNFHSLLQSIYESLNGTDGLNEMYWYDTAFRIGSYLNKFPEHIYLHRGTRVGAKALNIAIKEPDGTWRIQIEVSELPIELQDSSLKPYHYESLLCNFKDDFPIN